MKVIVAEKPSVGAILQSFLESHGVDKFRKRDGYLEGTSYTITWCVGHLVTLAEPDEYGWGKWDLQTLPMIPEKWRLTVISRTKKQYNIVKGLLTDATEIINATDAGREGELIFGLVIEKARVRRIPQKRLWLNSFVERDVAAAWSRMFETSLDNHLYQSALCRGQADWLVGMNLSRFYSLSSKVSGLSVGRVFTPTMAMIVKRKQDIALWTRKIFYELTAVFEGHPCTFYTKNGESRFEHETDLLAIVTECENKMAVVSYVKTSRKTTKPPKLFNLIELQKEAFRRFKLKANVTLQIAQSLYDQKLISYPRTDSQYLPESMLPDTRDIIEQLVSQSTREHLVAEDVMPDCFNSAKVTDHYALVPTGAHRLDQLPPNESRILGLIEMRLIQAFGTVYEYDEMQFAVDCNARTFKGCVDFERTKGFKALRPWHTGHGGTEQAGAGEAKKEKRLLQKGEQGYLRSLTPEQKEVPPPLPYNDATLLSAMETAGRTVDNEELREAMSKNGLGTPATRAAIIERLVANKYVTCDAKGFYSPTDKAEFLVSIVDQEVASPEMTGSWEYKLLQIAEGKLQSDVFMSEIYAYIKRVITKPISADALENRPAREQSPKKAKPAATTEACPRCKAISATFNSHGLFCGNPECGLKLWLKVAGKTLTKSQLHLLGSAGRTELIKGFKSREGRKFDAVLVLNENGKVTFSFDKTELPPEKRGARKKRTD